MNEPSTWVDVFVLNTKNVADWLGKSPRTIYRYCDEGILEEGFDFIRRGGNFYFSCVTIEYKRKNGFRLSSSSE